MVFYIAIALIPISMMMAALFVMFAKRDVSGPEMEEEPIIQRRRNLQIVSGGRRVHRATDPSF